MVSVRTIPLLPRGEQATLDGGVLAVSAAVCLAAAIVFGLLPALEASRPNLDAFLKESGRASTGGRRGRRLLGALIVVETALSVVLLAGAGLMLRSFSHLMSVPLGFRPERVLTVQIPSIWANVNRRQDPGDVERKKEYFRRVVERLQTIPGVRAAGLVTVLPLTPVEINTMSSLPGGPRRRRASRTA